MGTLPVWAARTSRFGIRPRSSSLADEKHVGSLLLRAAARDSTEVCQGPKDDPAEVAQDAFKALMAGDDKVVAGSVKNLLQTIAARLAPEQFKTARHAAHTKPKNLEEE
jgi:hypothetical protein